MESMEYNAGYNGDKEDGDMTASKVHTATKCSKPHSTPLTLKWLSDNYETADGVCLPRSTLYEHYLEFCRASDTNPVNAASFGKIIRQQFPLVTTRRLGTRGQSKYHYYGIGLKGSLNYINEHFHQSEPVLKVGTREGHNEVNPTKVKVSVYLPEFPKVKEMKLPGHLSESKVLTFMMMYRTHCQRILDTVSKGNIDEVSSLLLHFWQGMPTHVNSILHEDVVVKLVAVCDSLLYKTVAQAVMPSVIHPISDSQNQLIRKFSKHLVDWIRVAISGQPDSLLTMKLEMARNLSQLLKRQLSLNHLVQAARTVLTSQEVTGQLLHDWLSVDLNGIVKQTLYTLGRQSTDREHKTITEMCNQFEKLLEEQATMEAYINWLENMIEFCVLKASESRRGTLKSISRQFLLMWSCFGTRVIRDMTLHSAPSFGSFHLIHLMFNDYVLYRIETIHYADKTEQYVRAIKGETIDSETCDELALPNPMMSITTLRSHSLVHQVSLGTTTSLGSNEWISYSDSDYDSRSECFSSGEDSVDQSHNFLDHPTLPIMTEPTTSSIEQCIYRNDALCVLPSQHQPQHQRRQYHNHHHHHHQLQPQEHHHQGQATVSRHCSQHSEEHPHQPVAAPHHCGYSRQLNFTQQAVCNYNSRPGNGLLDNNGQFEFHCSDQIHHASVTRQTASHNNQTSHSYHSQSSLHDSPTANCMFSNQANEHAHSKGSSTRSDVNSLQFFSDFFGQTSQEFPSSPKRKFPNNYTDSMDFAKSSKRFKSSNTSLYL